MDLKPTLIALLVGVVPLAASAAPPCDGFDQAIEESLKSIGALTAEGAADDSAPRETSRQLKISNEIALIRIHLDLAARHQCPARKTPINELKYFAEALACQIARVKGEKDPASCKRNTWVGHSK